MKNLLLNFPVAFLMSGILLPLVSDTFPPRKPPLSVSPQHPGTSQYTIYEPQPAERVREVVLRVSSNGSFISRCLRMITREGVSKNFETITGQDGLTFGVTDFASDGGVHEFMKLMQTFYPKEFEAAFGDQGINLLNAAWIKKHNAGGHGKNANDNGLITFLWVREGLNRLLTNHRLYGLQLEYFKRGKVDPSLKLFEQHGFTREFTLAAMIGVANSMGSGGMRKSLTEAIKHTPGTGIERERAIVKRLLERYVLTDPHPGPADKELLENAFAGKTGLNEAGLGHRGRRAFMIFKLFPLATDRPFSGLGDFVLAEEERMLVGHP